MLKTPKLAAPSKTSGKTILAFLKTLFEKHWHEQITKVKMGRDNKDHNKLRTYSKLKQSFGQEPYIHLVRNRNQRMHLRLRTSAHNLGIERGRYKNIPVEKRFCVYCSPSTPRGATSPLGSGTRQPGSGTTPPGSGTTTPGSGTTPPGSSTTPPGSGTTPPRSGTTPPRSGTTPPGSPSPHPQSVDREIHFLNQCPTFKIN